jgi:hypothetical protein
MKTKLLITILAFFTMTAFVNAQNKQSVQAQQGAPVNRGAYVDANNNGVCDNFERPGNYYRNGGRRMMNANTPGNRRGLQPGQGRGLGPGQGRGLGPGQGRGQAPGGRYYSDSDKNGVCDYYEKTVKK